MLEKLDPERPINDGTAVKHRRSWQRCPTSARDLQAIFIDRLLFVQRLAILPPKMMQVLVGGLNLTRISALIAQWLQVDRELLQIA